MKTNFYRAVASAVSLFALTLGSAMAQNSLPAANPADSTSAVPVVVYRSVFRETSLGIEQEKLDWRKANNAVGRFERGHVDILKSEEMEEKKAMPAPTQAPTRMPQNTPGSAPTHKH